MVEKLPIPNSPICVLGAGSWGTALAIHLAKRGNQVRLWGNEPQVIEQMQDAQENAQYLPGIPFPNGIQCYSGLEDALQMDSTQDILVAVPSHAFEEILLKIKPLLRQPRIVWATKGLSKDGRLLHDIFEQVLPNTPYAVLSGPSFAKEVANGMPTAVTVASQTPAWLEVVQQRFHHHDFRVYSATDIVGVELGGVVKNVISIAVGMADGLGFGANARSALITRGIAELKRLALALGADLETLMGLSGLGDMVLTCSDNQSRNRRFGLYMAEGLSVEQSLTKVGQVVEGKTNAAQVVTLAKSHHIECPICEMVLMVIDGRIKPAEALDLLLDRPPRPENI